MRFYLNRIIPFLLLGAASLLFAEERIDLNRTTLERIYSLPIDSAKAVAIWERIMFEGPFKHLYEIGELPEIESSDLIAIRNLVRIDPPRPGDERLTRIDDAYYRIENLGTEEGTNVGLVDEWIDRLLEPMNVNDASLDELMDLQNVSPADAVAIYRQVKLQGAIRGRRDLRSVPGLSSWGYRNARNYLGYEAYDIEKKVHGSYTFRAYNTPFFFDEELAIDQEVLVDPRPDVSHKLRVNYTQDFKSGLLWHRNLGEETTYQKWLGNEVPEFKWFSGTERQLLGSVRIDRAYIGDYQVSLGQGVAMESGDYFSPRYSGFGFDKRITGIAPDLSRSQEFTLRGTAFEATFGKFKGIGFFSSQRKDAIINPDGSLNRLITLVPRIDSDIYPSIQKIENGDSVYIPAFDGKQSMLNAVREVGIGGEFAYRPWYGTSIGFIATEFSYDREMHPTLGGEYKFDAYTDIENMQGDTTVSVYSIVDPEEQDEILSDPMNSEILNGYHSEESGLWSESKSRRRIFGLNLATVVNNYTFQLEYAELEKTGSVLKVGDDPHGMVASVHAQWNSFTMLALFRDYEIGYDNPYSHGFSNYSRYNGTIYEDEFYLSDPVFAQLERNSAGPQAESGVFFQTRYQVSRPLLVVGELDNWTRVADQADYYRWVAKITYRPIWPMVIRLRQKLQGRWDSEPEQPSGFQSYENRINLEYRLSRFNELELLYSSGYTRFTPRPRLANDPDPTGEHPIDAQASSPSEAMGIEFRHHFTPRLKVKGAWLIYDGFFWNFEDTEFTVLDGRASRWWFSIANRLSNAMSVNLKITGDSPFTRTFVQARDNNEYPDTIPGREYNGDNVSKRNLSFRIQVDYLF